MRERLAQLLRSKSCWNNDCPKGGCEKCDYIGINDETAEQIADYLIANGAVVPPCKVGDEVFYLHEMCDENDDEYLDISAGKCEGISMQKDGLWMFCRYEDGLTFWHKSDKTVFFNREDAERALKGDKE